MLQKIKHVIGIREPKYINLSSHNRIIKNLNSSLKNGLQLYYKRNYYKISLGVLCLVIAFIPNGLGFIFYPMGFILLGVKRDHLLNSIKRLKYKMRGFKVNVL